MEFVVDGGGGGGGGGCWLRGEGCAMVMGSRRLRDGYDFSGGWGKRDGWNVCWVYTIVGRKVISFHISSWISGRCFDAFTSVLWVEWIFINFEGLLIVLYY